MVGCGGGVGVCFSLTVVSAGDVSVLTLCWVAQSCRKCSTVAAQCRVSNSYSSNVAFRPQRPQGQYIRDGEPTTSTSTFTQLLNSEVLLLNFMNKNGLRVLSVQSRVQFSSRAYLCAQKSPHALRLVSQKFPQRCR